MAGMSPNVLLIDAEYLDRVAAHLAANLQPAIGRQLPKADLAQWLVCCALDAGLSAGNNEVQAIFIHPREMKVLSHFAPGHFAAQLDGKAFSDALGEFTMAACTIERVTTLPDFYKESFEALLLDAAIERIARAMLPMIQRYYESDDGKRELAAWKQKHEEETYANQQ